MTKQLPIIAPIDIDVLKSELNSNTFVKKTNNGGNEIHMINVNTAPHVLYEIGRLREQTFRNAGGGTGKDCDLDEFDLDKENPFEQLIVWNPVENEIVGAYRFIHGKSLKVRNDGKIHTPTTELFDLSDEFIKDYLPYTIELGRSFVSTAYQPQVNIRKGLFALDNVWDGLGSIITQNPDVKYFFGKITMYPDYDTEARDMILYFMKKYFGDRKNLVIPIAPLKINTPEDTIDKAFTANSIAENYKILAKEVRKRKEIIPPLVNAYINLSDTMLYFGTSLNEEFGAVEESGILITINDIYDIKKERHLK